MLHARSAVLDGGRRRAEERHTTLRSTIEWSYRLLEPGEQRLFCWLAVFVDGFELDAARHLGAAAGIDAVATTEQVASLIAKSMLAVEPGPGGARYRMLETMRAFAYERLDARDERASALEALARWMTTIAGLPAAEPCTAAVERCSIRLERETDNWREAVDVAVRLQSGELAAGLCGPPAAFFLLGRHDLAEVVRPLLEVCAEPSQRRAVLSAADRRPRRAPRRPSSSGTGPATCRRSTRASRRAWAASCGGSHWRGGGSSRPRSRSASRRPATTGSPRAPVTSSSGSPSSTTSASPRPPTTGTAWWRGPSRWRAGPRWR